MVFVVFKRDTIIRINVQLLITWALILPPSVSTPTKPIQIKYVELRPAIILPLAKVPSFPDRRAHYEQMVDDQKKAAEAAVEAAQAAEALAEQHQTAAQAEAAQEAAIQAQAQAVANSNAAMMFIFDHESGNNPYAINPSSGACGLGQALPCSKMPCSLGDYACQVNYFTGYANERYGGWANAAAFWRANSWW